jgi:hypothetical protein
MDFMKWISSLDELLYEVTSWLLFFPLMLWRSFVHPLATMDYAEQQLALPEDEQYKAALTPPLFLALALLLAHGVSAALGQTDEIVASRHGMATLINDDTSALVLRLVVFGAFPIFAAARFVRRSGLPLDRATLRIPFYAQCCPTAILALGLGLGSDLLELSWRPGILGGALLMVASILYYVVIETRWFAAKLVIGPVRAFGVVMLGLLEGTALLVVVGYLLAR